MVERQRGDDHLLSLMGERAQEAVRLEDVGDHVPVGEHRALGDSGGASGVLEEREIPARELHRSGRRPAARVERVIPADHAVDPEPGHELLDVPHHEVHQRRLREAEHVAEAGHDDVLHLGVVDALLEHVPEVLEHHDRARAGIGELMAKLACGVQRVRADDDETGAQRAEERNRILQDVRHHQGDALTLGEPGSRGEEPREVLCEPIELGEGDAHADVLEGRAVRETGDCLVDKSDERRVRVGVDLVRRTLGIAVEPNFFHCRPPRRFQCSSSPTHPCRHSRDRHAP